MMKIPTIRYLMFPIFRLWALTEFRYYSQEILWWYLQIQKEKVYVQNSIKDILYMSCGVNTSRRKTPYLSIRFSSRPSMHNDAAATCSSKVTTRLSSTVFLTLWKVPTATATAIYPYANVVDWYYKGYDDDYMSDRASICLRHSTDDGVVDFVNNFSNSQK